MTDTLTLCSPAKLNLFLHVTGRRGDGYHTLQTIFQLLDWGDTLQFRLTDAPGVTLHTPQDIGVPNEQNLIMRAAQSLDLGSRGIDITLQKRIPMGGGLGGGSSNAATTLLALNHLLGLGHGTQTLCSIGQNLGADVPVFVAGRSAWAEGIGEILTPMDLPEDWFLVVAPECHIPTAEIFSDQELTRNSPPIKMSAFSRGHSRNDCQTIVSHRYPEVGNVLNFLEKYWEPRLTGTGACVFVQFATKHEADAARAQLPSQWQSFVAKGVNRSPTLAALH